MQREHLAEHSCKETAIHQKSNFASRESSLTIGNIRPYLWKSGSKS